MSVILPAVLFTLLGLACVALVVVGLPGTWILVALAVAVELADTWWLPSEPPVTFGWWVIAICVGLAAVGEGLEFLSGLIGTKGGGGTRRGMVGALLGGLGGALVGSVFLPVVGTLVGALAGTFAGALAGETTGENARSTKDALQPAIMATIARVLGTVAKVGIALVVLVVLSVAAFV